MSIPSLEFLLGLFALVCIFHALPSRCFRVGLLTACNIAFVCSQLPNSWSRIAVALFMLSGYPAARILQRRPRSAILATYLVLLIACFMILKKYALAAFVLPGWVMEHPVVAVGLSYMLFRQIHFVVDVMQQQIAEFSLLSYVDYQLNLFGFISGPIQRYQDYDPHWRQMQPILQTRYEILRAYLRIFIGVIKVSLISTAIFGLYEWHRARFLTAGELNGLPRSQTLVRFIIIFYGYPLYLYFNFSGYCDIVIAAAALVGIKMPENFDRPYLSRNVTDYWTRFHQSLGFWIRDYLFTPMYKALATRWPERANVLVFPCYFVAFIFAGIWHGNSMNFVVFGLLHGGGVCAGKLWEYWIIQRRGRKGLKAYLASRPIEFAAIVLTLHFVAITMLFFPQSVGTAMTIVHNFVHYMKA